MSLTVPARRPGKRKTGVTPLSSYGRSKWEGEKRIQASGAPQLIIRTSWIYAAQGTNFLRTMNRLARERDELRVVADQFGAPTLASSIAETVAMILARSASAGELAKDFRAAHGVIHLANSGSTSWHGFASAIVEGLKASSTGLATATSAGSLRKLQQPSFTWTV
jgi:dTDP-4-dehydrorhamnose reductase